MARPFRVIVVGGGVGGLVASHVLQKAGIDHVVLESKAEAAPAEGASIAIYPHGSRILEQIGVLDAARKLCVPMDQAIMRWPDGSRLSSVPFFDHVRDNHGYDILLFERRDYLGMLYDTLHDQSRIRFGARVVGVEETSAGVKAQLADGSSEAGDMVIGCDGVHSFVREAMWARANERVPGIISAAEKRSMQVSWNCLIGVAPQIPGAGLRDMTVVHGDRHSLLVLGQPKKLFFFVFFKLERAFHWPNWPRWSEADAAAAAAKVAEVPISESVLFGEVWKKRLRGQLVSIEEGVLQHWHWGRTVLAGDAVHKVTPNIALGGNLAMESVAVLANLVVQAVRTAPGGKPGMAEIEALFGEYQRARVARAQGVCDVSRLVTRLQAWDGWMLRAMACYLGPLQREQALAEQLAPVIRAGPRLDFVPWTGRTSHAVAWADERADESEPAASQWGTRARMLAWLMVGATVVMLLAAASPTATGMAAA
ncbi:fad binding domain-containing protein [Diplodia corticola]|uniref:Fad binding domain-containing protein n=1 Tax=Diplodia corticola TaxID=236234 RepID=A0A1J9QQ01_9PEZI|nr:fad binding domain-containing protein [Diplodia corticola]OJD31006.1 fad binding domain-containing protein [Diplodia corticola]